MLVAASPRASAMWVTARSWVVMRPKAPAARRASTTAFAPIAAVVRVSAVQDLVEHEQERARLLSPFKWCVRVELSRRKTGMCLAEWNLARAGSRRAPRASYAGDNARTGAPACASTALIPTVRSNVLLPDMFEPLTTNNRSPAPRWRSLRTQRSSGSRGWPRPFPSNSGSPSTSSGKGSSGCS